MHVTDTRPAPRPTRRKTDARSSGIALAPDTLAALRVRRNLPAVRYFLGTGLLLAASGVLLHLALGSMWALPAMVLYGSLLTTAAYALSHETAHRTAFTSTRRGVLHYLADLHRRAGLIGDWRTRSITITPGCAASMRRFPGGCRCAHAGISTN